MLGEDVCGVITYYLKISGQYVQRSTGVTKQLLSNCDKFSHSVQSSYHATKMKTISVHIMGTPLQKAVCEACEAKVGTIYLTVQICFAGHLVHPSEHKIRLGMTK